MKSIKKIVFWLDMAFCLVLLAGGVVLITKFLLLGSESSSSSVSITKLLAYLMSLVWKGLTENILVSFMVMVIFGLYYCTLFYSAQTALELKLAKLSVPLGVLAILLSCTGIFGIVMSGLAMQGGGN